MTDEKPKRKGGRKPDPPAQMFVTFHYVDSNGNRVAYDATDKNPGEFPEEVRAVINAKNDKLYRDIIIPKFWRWVEGLESDLRESIKAAARSKTPEAQEQFRIVFCTWCDALLGRKKAAETGE